VKSTDYDFLYYANVLPTAAAFSLSLSHTLKYTPRHFVLKDAHFYVPFLRARDQVLHPNEAPAKIVVYFCIQ